MKFKEYLKELNKLAEDRPESLEFDVITAGDDEGNSYHSVYYSPVIGQLRDFTFYESKSDESESPSNVVLLN